MRGICLSVASTLHVAGPQDLAHYLYYRFNSLAPGRCGSNVKSIIFKLFIQNNSLAICCEITVQWMPPNLTK